MNKLGKAISTVVLMTTVGTAAVSVGADAETKFVKQVKPYYTYNGYVYNNGSFLLDQYFVMALKHDNVKINGYKIDPKAKTGLGGKEFKVKDVTMLKDSKGKIGHMRFDIKSGTVKKSAFFKAHRNNKIVSETVNADGSGATVFKTDKAHYLVSYSKNYVVAMEIGVLPQ